MDLKGTRIEKGAEFLTTHIFLRLRIACYVQYGSLFV